MSLTRPLVYCALLLFALTGLLAAPVSAQAVPARPQITRFGPTTGQSLQYIFVVSGAVTTFEASIHSWTAGSGRWRPLIASLQGTINFVNLPVSNNLGIPVDSTTLYRLRVRVWNTNTPDIRSAWAYAYLGPRYDLKPPNIIDGRLNTHMASPVVVFSSDDYSRFHYYAVDEQSEGLLMGSTPSTLALAAAGVEASTLGETANPVSGKPVVISWDGVGLVTVSTYYADAEYAMDKPFSFTIDAEEEVTILEW